jgi:hypothetical protein
MTTRILFLITFFYSTNRLDAQDTLLLKPDTLQSTTTAIGNPDSSLVIRKRPLYNFLHKDYPSPRKAMLLSFVLPGAGQLYNKRWWKLPIAYGLFGGGVYLYRFNRNYYRVLRTEYVSRVDANPVTLPDAKYSNISDQSIRFFRDQYRNQADRIGLGLVLVYFVVAADAFVDAHLKNFDISDDLSLKLQPAQLSGMPGLGIAIVPRP